MNTIMTTPDMSARAIARPVLAGYREIAALWLPAEWYDEATRRRLVLQAWRPGCTLARFPDGDLLRFASPFAGDCEALPGWPLQQLAGTLCSADVAPRQLASRVRADVLLAIGAEWRTLDLAHAAAVDPASWLDVSTSFVDMADCRLPPAVRVVVEPTARELREVLGPAVPAAPTAETQGLLKALAARRQASEAAARRGDPAFRSDQGAPAKVVIALAVVALLLILVSVLTSRPESGTGDGIGLPAGVLIAFGFLMAAFVRRRNAAPGQRQAAGTRRPATSAGAPREGAAARVRRALRALPARAAGRVVPQRWRRWAARLAMTTGVANLLGAQHSAYMQRMLKMFDDGHLDDALRHAIPLGGANESLGQSFGRLSPRDQLRLRQQRGPTSSIGMGDNLERHLRALYRRSFEQLDAKGRIDEAVFVLAELLNVRQEALDYLERHARFAQAAELALGWDMPAAQIVRLHALAGDWRVALLVARRDNAFETAVALLEKRWPEAAGQLRKEWAQSLAARGQWLAAVRVVWRLESERPAACEWLRIAESGGGAMAARALALRAQCLAETLVAHADLVDALRDDPALVHERAALADELGQLPAPTDAVRRLSALVAGAAIADLSLTGAADVQRVKAVRRLVEIAADPRLSADLPISAWPDPKRTPLASSDEIIAWVAPEAGSHALVDAVPLPDGEFLVALGEGGAVRVDARGQWRARFAAPAQQLVIAHDGRSALALARRERVWRVSRLDLVRGQVEDLGMHEFDAFARSFDGVGWSVAIDRRVQVLDTTRGLREVLWHVADLPGAVTALDVLGDTELWVMRTGESFETWNYALPARRLREIHPLAAATPDVSGRMLASGVGVIEFTANTFDDATAAVRALPPDGKTWKDIPWHGHEALITAAGAWLAVREKPATGATQQTIALINLGTGRVHGRWHWPLEAQVRLRAFEDAWLAFDDQGRLSLVSLGDGGQCSLSLR
jgi:hypothetical protein